MSCRGPRVILSSTQDERAISLGNETTRRDRKSRMLGGAQSGVDGAGAVVGANRAGAEAKSRPGVGRGRGTAKEGAWAKAGALPSIKGSKM